MQKAPHGPKTFISDSRPTDKSIPMPHRSPSRIRLAAHHTHEPIRALGGDEQIPAAQRIRDEIPQTSKRRSAALIFRGFLRDFTESRWPPTEERWPPSGRHTLRTRRRFGTREGGWQHPSVVKARIGHKYGTQVWAARELRKQ